MVLKSKDKNILRQICVNPVFAFGSQEAHIILNIYILCSDSISHIVATQVLENHFTVVVRICTRMLICPTV